LRSPAVLKLDGS